MQSTKAKARVSAFTSVSLMTELVIVINNINKPYFSRTAEMSLRASSPLRFKKPTSKPIRDFVIQKKKLDSLPQTVD